MNKLWIFGLMLTIGLMSCNPCIDLQEKLRKSEAALFEKTNELNAAMQGRTERSEASGKLVHVVYFDLKPDLTEKQKSTFFEDINKLKKIKFLLDLKIGTLAKSGDARMLSDFEMMMQMSFNSLDELAQYQAHKVHLELKKKAGNYLAAPPRVYDYWLK